jgi:hypothetical protein
MKKFIKFPSIEQFRTVVTNVNKRYNFVGLDDNGEPIYDHSLSKPVLTFKGTVKLHGTNASVCGNLEDGVWAQSRNNIITPESDNAGFAFFVESKKEVFTQLIAEVFLKNELDMIDNTVTIYGEWCGKSIQKNVGISDIDKSFFIFGVKITPNDENEVAYWVDYDYLRAPEHNIYNIDDYKTYSIDIDFKNPQLFQNKLSELTLGVEEECPVAKEFGFSGIGEGIVWVSEYKGSQLRFKVKGEKHAGKSKVKTLNKVDDEKIKKLIDVAEKVTPTWRLSQMLSEACDLMNGGTIDRSKLGDYLRLVIGDVIKEDMDILVDAGVEPKDVNKYISEIARRYFFEQELI